MYQKVDFRIAFFRRPIGRFHTHRHKFLQNKLFGQRTFKVSKEAVSLQNDGWRQIAHRSQEPDIMLIQLKCREILIRLKWQPRRACTKDLVNHPCLVKPFQCLLIIATPSPFFQGLVDVLLVFLGKLSRNVLPEKAQSAQKRLVCMLDKIRVIGTQDFLLNPTYSMIVTFVHKSLDRLWHATDKEVILQQTNILVMQEIHNLPLILLKRLTLQIFPTCRKKLGKGQWMHIQKRNLPDRK